jgi:hypothetical protein
MSPASTLARSTLGQRLAEPLGRQGLAAQATDILSGEHDRQQPGGRAGQGGCGIGAVIGLDGSKDGFSMARSACIIESRRSKGVSRELVWNSVPQAGEPDSSVEGCGAPAPGAAHRAASAVLAG